MSASQHSTKLREQFTAGYLSSYNVLKLLCVCARVCLNAADTLVFFMRAQPAGAVCHRVCLFVYFCNKSSAKATLVQVRALREDKILRIGYMIQYLTFIVQLVSFFTPDFPDALWCITGLGSESFFVSGHSKCMCCGFRPCRLNFVTWTIWFCQYSLRVGQMSEIVIDRTLSDIFSLAPQISKAFRGFRDPWALLIELYLVLTTKH